MPVVSRAFGVVMALCLAGVLAACSAPPVSTAPNDPFEAANRARFEANLALDRALPGPRDGAEPSEPGVLTRRVRSFGANLGQPATVLNDLLQLRPDRAAENALRFVINSTVGLAGLFDPAGSLGLRGRTTDFGETLHRWGMGEGAYLVLPVFGPSTERDTLGLMVDAVLNPWEFAVPTRTARAVTLGRLAGRFADRAAFADLIDANVMRAVDPYAQARLLFLQARRHHLGIATEDDAFDPYDFLD